MDEITQHELSPWWWALVFILPLVTLAAMHWAAFK